MAWLAVACCVKGKSGVALAVGSCQGSVWLAACTGVWLVCETCGALAVAEPAVSIGVEDIAIVAGALVIVQSGGLFARCTLVVGST